MGWKIYSRTPPELDQGRHQDLPYPPDGKVFHPLLKESYEIVLPVTVISGRYYWGVAKENISKHIPGPLTGVECGKRNAIKPIHFRAARANMLEYAYEMSRNQTSQIPESLMARVDDHMEGFTEFVGE
jgi:hypothetical protein